MKTQSFKFKSLLFITALTASSATMLQARDLQFDARSMQEFCNLALTEIPDMRVPRLLADHAKRTAKAPAALDSQQNIFEGVDGRDVYNNSAPFKTVINGQEVKIIAGRVEPRANHKSEVWFFAQKSPNVWVPVEQLYNLTEAQKLLMKFGKRKIGNVSIHGSEDPFVTTIDGETIVGFVETFDLGTLDKSGNPMLGYRTVFYRDHGRGLVHLERFATGPNGMKDIRLGQKEPGSPILVVARPQHANVMLGGRGKNAITWIASLDQLNATNIAKAKLIHGQTGKTEWIGTNKVFFLPDGDIGFLSHVAYYKNEKTGLRGYYATVYTISNPEPRIIFVRADLNELGELIAKRPDLSDVIFSGDMIINDDPNDPDFPAGYEPGETAWLYIGVGDALSYRVLIRNPFK